MIGCAVPPPPLRAGRPHGLSLVEVVVVLALLGLAAAAVGEIGVRQQANYRDVSNRTRARAGLREGAAVLAAELRGIAPAAGDLHAADMGHASAAFRSTVGSYVLCESPAGNALAVEVIDVADLDGDPAPTEQGRPATPPPSVGDSLLVYDSGNESGTNDDRWTAALITAVAERQRSCRALAQALPRRVFRLALSTPLDAVTETHAPARAFRRVRYALYRSSDGLWYLGFSDCRPLVRTPACAPLQPVSGPYEPLAAVGARRPSGLTLAWLDRAGAPTDDPHEVASVEMLFRARANDATRLRSGMAERHLIALRNRLP